jgi:excisionase family DNA binding protein
MTVYRLVHSGELPAVRFGRSYRVPESAVVEAVQRPVSDVG